MNPVLARYDDDPQGRSEKLARVRDELSYAWDRPEGVATARSLPKRLGYPPGVVAQVGVALAALEANKAAARLRGARVEPDRTATFESCAARFATIDLSSIAQARIDATHRGDRAALDALFAWERLAGANPFVLERLASIGDVGAVSPSFVRACGEGRAFVADYRPFLDGVSTAAHKFITAPVALFARGDGSSALAPVAIVIDGRVARPGDDAWDAAVGHVQVADANVQESFFHLGRVHFLLEAFAMATERQLSERHPLYVLLSPHFHGTLAINQAARDELVVPGGKLELLMAPTLDGSLSLVRRAVASFRFSTCTIAGDLERRGVLSTDALERFAYRDDALLVERAIREFCNGYIAVAYATDEEVATDLELRAWLDELGSSEGGRLQGLPAVSDRTSLVELVTFIVAQASIVHGAVNYTQGDFMGFVPGMPTSSSAAAPSFALPTEALANEQLSFMLQQTMVRVDRLGDYPPEHFRDRRVAPLVSQLRASLESASRQIAERQGERLCPYPYLDPATLAASVHI